MSPKKIRKEHKILILTQSTKTFADSYNRSKNERTFCPETFGLSVKSRRITVDCLISKD
jgi:hypothetical protein